MCDELVEKEEEVDECNLNEIAEYWNEVLFRLDILEGRIIKNDKLVEMLHKLICEGKNDER